MALSGVQLIYRLKNTIRLLIDYRDGSPAPDSFNFYWSSTEGGAYTSFATGIENIGSNVASVRGKIVFDFIPSLIAGWDNNQANYIKMAPVTGGVEGAQEGPMQIPTVREMTGPADTVVVYGFNKANQKYIPLAVDEDGKLITV